MTLRPALHFHKGTLLAPEAPTGVPLSAAVPIARLSTMRGNPGKWWTAPAPDAASAVGWADANRVPVDDDVREYAAHAWAHEVDALALATAATLPFGQTCPPVSGLTAELLPAQKVAVLAATRCRVELPGKKQSHRALIVADDPGLGKTLEALAMLRVTGSESERALVICPTSLTANWVTEAGQHFQEDTFTPWVATTKTPSPVPEGVDLVVIGWEILGAWVEELKAWKPDTVVTDEGHYGKAGKSVTRKVTEQKRGEDGKPVRDEFGNIVLTETVVREGGSQRADAFLALGADVAKRGGFALALTGTPVVNRPIEMEPLIEYAGFLEVFGGSKAFKERYCDPKTINAGGRYKTLYNGASNLLELNRRLAASGHYLRRTKEILVDAGLLKRKYVDGVYVFDTQTGPNPWMLYGSPEQMQAYRKVEGELQEFFAERARVLAGGRPLESAQVQKQVSSEGHKHLKKIAQLRHAAAEIKVEYIIDKVRSVVESGEKVVIAAHHKDVVDAYAEAFTGLKIQGGMGNKKIEEAKALFNETSVDEHPVLVLSVEAGKTGHTLCKQALNGAGPSCAYMVFAEQVWTPGDEIQAQDRIWRIGQEREVRIINALLADSIDLVMFGQRLKKRKIVNSVLNAAPEDAFSPSKAESQGAGIVAWQLAQRGLFPENHR